MRTSTAPMGVLSNPRFCICGGTGRVLVAVGVHPLTGARAGQTTRCPHCQDEVPVAHLPWLAEERRTA